MLRLGRRPFDVSFEWEYYTATLRVLAWTETGAENHFTDLTGWAPTHIKPLPFWEVIE